MSESRSLVERGKIGGIDIALLAETDRIRVWEKPQSLPHWNKVLGGMPAVAVNRLEGGPDWTARGSLFITVSGLERYAMSRLILDPGECDLFRAKTGLALRLSGFNEALLNAHSSTMLAATKLRWDYESIYVPGVRLCDSEPSKMIASPPIAIANLNSRSFAADQQENVSGTSKGLGELVNGLDLPAKFLGMMVECD